jgi:hypothetical protein
VPAALRSCDVTTPGCGLHVTDTHRPESLQLLRAGEIDAALIFRYDQTPPELDGIRLVHILDDPTYLLTREGGTGLVSHRDST